jgi:hypothetical protein
VPRPRGAAERADGPAEPDWADWIASINWPLRIPAVPFRPSWDAICYSSGRTSDSRPDPLRLRGACWVPVTSAVSVTCVLSYSALDRRTLICGLNRAHGCA